MSTPTLLAVSHGTSNIAGAAAIRALVRRVAEALPGVDVREAFVDVQEPRAPEALAAITGPVVIVPLLLSTGLHVDIDLGRLRKKRDDLRISPPLGPDPRLAEVLAKRLTTHTEAPIILAVAGSRTPGSVVDAEHAATLLTKATGRHVTAAYLAAREPSILHALAAAQNAVVATYLLAEGYFNDLLLRLAGGREITAPILDGNRPDQALVDLVVQRYQDATRAF